MEDAWTRAALASAAGMMAVCFTHPLDVIKVRLQLDLELQKRTNGNRTYRGWSHCAALTWRNEGIRGLQRGLAVALVREALFNGVRIGMYDPLLYRVAAAQGTSPGDAGGATKLGVGLFCGMSGAVACNPLDILKTRFQSSGGLTGHQHGYATLRQAAASQMRQEGLRGWAKGLSVNALRGTLGPGTQLPTYNYLKERIPPALPVQIPPVGLHALCAMGSAAVSIAVMNPVDVVRTRLYNQPFDDAGRGKRYAGGVDAFRKILAAEGPLAFYKGGATHYARLGPHIVLVFVFLEQLKMALL